MNNNKKMLVIFSHNLTKVQINDAKKQFKINKFIRLPYDLQNLWSNIPPDISDINELLNPIKDWIKRNANVQDYILVQGDFGATYIIVNYSKANALIPIYSTTKRVALEKENESGEIEIVHNFKHILFRKY